MFLSLNRCPVAAPAYFWEEGEREQKFKKKKLTHKAKFTTVSLIVKFGPNRGNVMRKKIFFGKVPPCPLVARPLLMSCL